MSSINDMVFNWLRARKRKKDLRVLIKELSTCLSKADQQTQAMIFAMAIVFKKRVIDKSAQLSKALNYPQKMSKERLGLIFELLQAIQKKMDQEKKGLDQKLAKMDIVENSPITHWEMSLQGMNLWMITIGSNYDPRIQSKVNAIWQVIDKASEHIPEAITSLRSLEHTVQDFSENDSTMYGQMSDDEWAAECQFRPGATVS